MPGIVFSVMRYFIGIILLCVSASSIADEWDEALKLDSYGELEEFWESDVVPMDAMREMLRFQGPLRTEVDVLIRKDGTAVGRITSSSGNEEYDLGVMKIVEQYRYRPTEQNDPPRAVVVPYYRSAGPR